MTTEPNADVERVALAIGGSISMDHKPDTDPDNPWCDSVLIYNSDLNDAARAAIAAMPDREVTVQEAARVLLNAKDDDRTQIYEACEKTCKVYKFNSVLRDIAGDKP